jgi:outer membrane protein
MKLFAIGAAALVSLSASAVMAQTAAPVTHGAAIPGVCVFFSQGAVAQSNVGKAVAARLDQLEGEVRTELQPYATHIQTEGQALQQGAATIPADQRTQRGQALQQRYEEFQTLQQTRSDELRYTAAMQQQAIAQAMDPLVVAAYQEKGCSVLLNRESIFMANPAMDLTATVVQRLNTALPTLSFNRMPVPAQPQS